MTMIKWHLTIRKLILVFSFKRDSITVVLAKDHAPERKGSFYAEIQVNVFVVDRLKKKKVMKKSAVQKFSVYYCSGVFTYFESLTTYRNTHRAGCVSERLITAAFESSEPLFLLRLKGCVSAIPT